MKTSSSARLFKPKVNQQEKVLTAVTDDDGVVHLKTWIVLRPGPDEQIFEEDVEKKLKR